MCVAIKHKNGCAMRQCGIVPIKEGYGLGVATIPSLRCSTFTKVQLDSLDHSDRGDQCVHNAAAWTPTRCGLVG